MKNLKRRASYWLANVSWRLLAVLLLGSLFSLVPAGMAYGQAPTLEQARQTVAKATPAQKAAWLSALAKDRAAAEAHRMAAHEAELAKLPAGLRATAAFRMAGQACTGVGYLPPQFAGKPDPWPNDHPLPNDELLAAHIARYGQPPGSGGARVGYCCELFGWNQDALEHAGAASETLGGVRLHPGCSTITEQTDASFTIARCSPPIHAWVWENWKDGSTPAMPSHEDDPGMACGATWTTSDGAGKCGWPYYHLNDGKHCGIPPPPPPDPCGNGKPDPGETCSSCPADLGPCAPPPPPPPACPATKPITATNSAACQRLLVILGRPKPGSGLYRTWLDGCGFLAGATAFLPGLSSTAQNRLELVDAVQATAGAFRLSSPWRWFTC